MSAPSRPTGSSRTWASGSTATVLITPIDDADAEGLETVVLTVVAGSGYEVGAPDTAEVTIIDDDAVAELTIDEDDVEADEYVDDVVDVLEEEATEDIYKIYAESFLGAEHLLRIQQEAQAIVSAALGGARS